MDSKSVKVDLGKLTSAQSSVIRKTYIKSGDIKKIIRRNRVKFVADSYSKAELETRINDTLEYLEITHINDNFKLSKVDVLVKDNDLSNNVPVYYYAVITYSYDEELK